MTFGIPVQVMPVQVDGSIDLEHHKLWVDQQRKIEARRRRDGHQGCRFAIIPGQKDILFGRDKIARSHPGNARFLHLISTLQEQYDGASSKEERFIISAGIVSSIKESGGRFLKFEEAGWEVVDDTVARYKVTNTFRSYRKKQNSAIPPTKESVGEEKLELKRDDEGA